MDQPMSDRLAREVPALERRRREARRRAAEAERIARVVA